MTFVFRSATMAALLAAAAPAPAAPRPAETHWAFKPVVAPAVPAVKDDGWPKTPIDRFVLAALEAKGVKPAAPADKRTLIRRATLDLTGLPPTPDEVEAFVKDDSAEAYEKLVDRLLASPHYGERWGRHWLDVARYADSNGLDENVAHGNAWRYRDYVVARLNDDVPFDRFVLEQIAGDLLPAADAAERRRSLVATGFLSLGPKVLAEVDEKKMELDIVDEQVDTLGRAFLGMTFGCARCHDHKFDPVSQADYYGLAGIFAGTKTMDSFTKIAKWHENSLAAPEQDKAAADHAALVAKATAALKAAANDADKKRLTDELAALQKSAPPEPPMRHGRRRGQAGRSAAVEARQPPQAGRSRAPPLARRPGRGRAAAAAGRAEWPARTGQVGRVQGQPADGPRHRQPRLALALRQGAGAVGR